MLHNEDTGIRHFFAPEEFAERSTRTPESDLCFADSVFFQNSQNIFFRAVAVDTFHRTLVHILAYSFPVSFFQTVCQMNLANHGRQYMAAFQIEIIIRAVKVCRHHGDVVRSILQVEALAHFQSGNFGDCIRLVGIFQR